MNLPQRTPLYQRLVAELPILRWQRCRVLLGVSGGADSTAMLRFFAAIPNFQIAAIHVNHGTRANESDDDAEFVESLCQQLGIKMFVKNIAGGDSIKPGRSEAVLRKIRYDCFLQTAESGGYRYVALAHTADDQVETVLHRIVRGTGLRGLTGIPPFRPLSAAVTCLRPFLEIRREEILSFLAEIQQTFRTDSSNLHSNYTRNRIRNELLPQLQREYNPAVGTALLRLMKQSQQVQRYISPDIEAMFHRAIHIESPHLAKLFVAKLNTKDEYIVCECLHLLWQTQGWPLGGMTYEKWLSVWQMTSTSLSAQAQSEPAVTMTILPGGIRVHRDTAHGCLIFHDNTLHGE